MTRTVFTNDGLAHAWVSMTYDHGKSSNGNFYFQGATIYSYGGHFPIARIVDNEWGEALTGSYGALVAFFNADSYSVSTGQHVNKAYRASSHINSFSVPALGDFLQILDCSEKAARESWARQYIQAHCIDAGAAIIEKTKRMRAEWKIQHAESQAAHLVAVARLVWNGICKRKSDPMTAIAKETKARARSAAKHKLERAIEHVRATVATCDPVSTVEGFKGLRLAGRYQENPDDPLLNFDGWLSHMDFQIKQMMANAISWRPGATTEKDARRLIGVAATTEALALQKERDEKVAIIHAWVNGQRAKFNAMKAEESKGAVDKWLAGGDARRLPYSLPCMLRIKNGDLQTSKGASVPVADAITLTKSASLCRARGKGWRRNGETKPVGAFQTDRITKSGDLIVGCHSITWGAIVDCVERHASELPFDLIALVERADCERVKA